MNTKHHLLVVDGNPYVSAILTQTLCTHFNVTVASTGQEAIRFLLQGNRFDCVLTELNLPLIGGLELTKFIRTNKLLRHTPVIVLSNALDSDTRIECLEQGVDSYIAKPFNPLEVRAKLTALLRRTAPAVDETHYSPVSSRPQLETKSFHQPESRLLSMTLKPYTTPQRI